MKKYLLLLAFVSLALADSSAQFVWRRNSPMTISIPDGSKSVVRVSLGILQHDSYAVFGDSVREAPVADAQIVVSTDATHPDVVGRKEAFAIEEKEGRLFIVGSDAHGTAYGLLKLSRLMGVSPWEWWADVAIMPRSEMWLPAGYRDVQSPSVEFRGIFINDEDWGMATWRTKAYEPRYRKMNVGPDKVERIFELLLRLRVNTYWPAMHECTTPFFLTSGNREMAEKYGIYIGTSHCEPMACNAAGEWGKRGKGSYDFINNYQAVHKFWEERVKSVAHQEVIYTIGMRGVHDSGMLGAKTVDERRVALARVFEDQRALLAQYVDSVVERVPQIFIPYKEVLDVYESGLKVPDDVTIMWPDDNFGYITRYPSLAEQQRSGGCGVYYHVSYWGAPHDYLWLSTQSPALLCQQMLSAYDHGARKIWILNVGDLKPAEYHTELFMDLAWNVEKVRKLGPAEHLRQFLVREFGKVGGRVASALEEHYRLAFIHKPEFMGNGRTYQGGREKVCDMPWSENYLRQRLAHYQAIADSVACASQDVATERQYAFFQLVGYPVLAAAQMNRKLILGQLARHGRADWHQSDLAFDSIAHLSNLYNSGFDANGKWARMMDFQPRRLPVFDLLPHSSDSSALASDVKTIAKWNGADAKGGGVPLPGLGYEGRAVSLPKGASLEWHFDNVIADSVSVDVALVPTFPIDGQALRIAVSLDGGKPLVVDCKAAWHSEEWKQNVLYNRTVKSLRFPLRKIKPSKQHRISLQALDEGVVVDEVALR